MNLNQSRRGSCNTSCILQHPTWGHCALPRYWLGFSFVRAVLHFLATTTTITSFITRLFETHAEPPARIRSVVSAGPLSALAHTHLTDCPDTPDRRLSLVTTHTSNLRNAAVFRSALTHASWSWHGHASCSWAGPCIMGVSTLVSGFQSRTGSPSSGRSRRVISKSARTTCSARQGPSRPHALQLQLQLPAPHSSSA